MADETKQLTEEQIFEGMFFSLVISLSTAAMSQMGKIANPVSQKIERNLTQARGSIDMLRMIKTKTEGNLSENEKGFLEKTVNELQMNFLDEVKKGDEPAEVEAVNERDGEPSSAKEPASVETTADKTEATGETARPEDKGQAEAKPAPEKTAKKKAAKKTNQKKKKE